MAKNKIYYRSGQGFRLKLTGAEGEPLPLDEIDWCGRLYTGTTDDHYIISHTAAEGWLNCAPVPEQAGEVYVDLQNCNLLPGSLMLAIETSDGARYKFALDIELVPCPVTNVTATVEATLPVVPVSLAPYQAQLGTKADAANVYTKTETDAKLGTKADKATTLAGYGITDVCVHGGGELLDIGRETYQFVKFSRWDENAKETKAALATKADAAETTAALETKADAAETTAALATKADAAETSAALETKADAAAVYTKAETDTKLATKANAADIYTKTEADTKLGTKANAADVYTKAEADSKLGTKANTADVYTKAETDTKLGTKANAADVYTKAETDTALVAKQDKLEDSADIHVDTNSLTLTDAAKQALFVDMWLKANDIYYPAGLSFGYDEETGLFSLRWENDKANTSKYFLDDITYEDALKIYHNPMCAPFGYSSMGVTPRVSLPPVNYHVGSGPVYSVDVSDNTCMGGSNKSDVIILSGISSNNVANFYQPFSLTGDTRVKAIIGWLSTTGEGRLKNAITTCSAPKLEYLRIYLKQNFNIAKCPVLDLGSFQFMVAHASNTAAITITVHPDVYAKLTDTDNTEWHKVLTDGAAKNISFATV